MLEIKDLHVEVEGKEILKGINLNVKDNEIHALMGPNGAGKSSLNFAIAGHPKYKVTKGDILFNGESILNLKADERARLGIFLGFQYPTEIQGLTIQNFLSTMSKSLGRNDMTVMEFLKYVKEKAEFFGLNNGFLNRELNYGLSGGEKKKVELLQLLIAKPKLAILDEIDSGLDFDSMNLVSKTLGNLRGNGFSGLIVTHYKKILDFIKPDFIHVLVDGEIVLSGDYNIAEQLEEKGYSWVKNEAGD